MHGLAKSHGFVDGNKRTALRMALMERSGYSLPLDDDREIADVIVAVVEDEMSEEALVEWFRVRLVRT